MKDTTMRDCSIYLSLACHWLRIITILSGYVIENLTWILYTTFLNVSGESGYDSKPVMSYQMIAIFPAPNGRVDDYTDRPHKLIYPS